MRFFRLTSTRPLNRKYPVDTVNCAFKHITHNNQLAVNVMFVLLRFSGDVLEELTMAKHKNEHREICQLYLQYTFDLEIR